MQTDSKNDQEGKGSMEVEKIAFCAHCQTSMTGGLRFCRWCGNKVGEGSTELTGLAPKSEGDDVLPPSSATTALPQPEIAKDKSTVSLPMPRPTPNGWDWSGIDSSAPPAPVFKHNTAELPKQARGVSPVRRRLLIAASALVLTSLSVGGFIWYAKRRPAPSIAENQTTQQPAARSYFGSSEFKDADGGGAFFDYTYPPGGPSDKAGLIGGDVIISFDAQSARNADDLKRLVAAVPVGKTVQVVYIRDGQTQTTKLTTVSKNEIDRLDRAYDERPEGKGFMGEGNELKRVLVPELNIYGAQVNGIRPNLPADKSGMLNGDVVIEIDGTPIRTNKELEMRVERSIPDTVIKVTIVRAGIRSEIPIQLGRTY